MKTEPAAYLVGDPVRSMLFWQVGILAALFVLLYARLLPELLHELFRPTHSYGILVPFITAYLVWKKRHTLRNLTVAPNLWGTVTIFVSLLLFLLGQLMGETLFMRVSMILTLAGLIQACLGNHFLTQLGFPLFYLTLVIPVPFTIANQLSNFLMLFHARESVHALRLMGVPVYIESNFLHLPNIILEVAEVCSGVSSIFALFVLGMFYTSLLPIPVSVKAIVTLCTIPLAVIANLIRIILVVAATYRFGPVVLETWLHILQGTFNFLIAFMFLVVLGETLRRKYSVRSAVTDGHSLAPQAVPGIEPSWSSLYLSILILLSTVWLSNVLTAPSSFEVSSNLDGFTVPSPGFPQMPEAWPDFYTDERAERAYMGFFRAADGSPLEVFVGYKSNNTSGPRLQSPRTVFPPKWSTLSVAPVQVPAGAQEAINASLILSQSPNGKRLVLYWYQTTDGTFRSELYYRLAVLWGRLRDVKSGIFVIRLATPLGENGNVKSVQGRLELLARAVYDELKGFQQRKDVRS